MATDSGPKSLRDLVYHHNGFLVNPLQWTSSHLDLVGCRFEDVSTISAYAESAQDDCKDHNIGRTSLKPRTDAEVMAEHLMPQNKLRSLVNILVGKEHSFAYHSNGPPFYFQGHPVHRPEYIVFSRHKQSLDYIYKSPPPLIGYVHYTSVDGARRDQFEPRPNSRRIYNQIGMRICMKRLNQTTPKDWTEDPYFVCHLLALAQLQERKFDSPQPSYTSRLLATNVRERECLLLYEAEVPAELLSGLKNPKTAANIIPWPIIHRKKIQYKPYDTFADRLIAELVAPSLSENGTVKLGKKRLREQKDCDTNKKRPISSTCFVPERHDRQKLHRNN